MSYHLLVYEDRGGGAVRPWRPAGSDPRLGLTGPMGRSCARGCS